jgi:hypothetical protein
MPEPGGSTPVDDLAAAVASSHADRAADAAVRALRAKTPALEVLRVAALAAAGRFDPALRRAPMGIVTLGSASNLLSVLQPRFHALPVLQAVTFAASEKKSAQPARPPLVVRGEITHLGRSFLFAARDGNLPEAEAIFLGIVTEGAEHRMAGDMLFRAALEDMGDGGLKLVTAVKLWQLARSLRFRDARALLRPAIGYLAAGTRDSTAYRVILEVLGKDWVDLEALSTGGRPLDEAGRSALDAAVSLPDPAARTDALLRILRDGCSAAGVADGLAIAAARSVVASGGSDRDAALALAFAHSARFVVTFSRTPERIYAVFQAALRIRPARGSSADRHGGDTLGEGEELCHLAGDLEARRPGEAASRTAAYLRRGHDSSRLLDVLANYAARDSALATDGMNLILADVCAAEHLATRASEPAAALAACIAASPADWAAYRTWTPLLEP